MKLTWRVLGVIAMCGAGACLLPGCGKGDRAGRGGPALRETPAQKADVPLPEWAPKNPSPEFLRAARMLRPMPEDLLKQAAQGQEAQEGFFMALTRTWTATYELFGSLDDRQIERFRKTKRVYVPAGSMTQPQRAALQRWFDVWRKAMAGTTPPNAEYLRDYLVFAYKEGARKDFSNVEVGFDVPEGMAVHLRFRIAQPDGRVKTPGITFAFYD